MPEAMTARIVNGPLARELARFGTPLALGMALQTTFNLVDAYLVAQLPPDEVGPALGALGICDQIAAIGTILSYGVSTAAASLMSQHKGAGREDGVRAAAWQSLLVVTALSIVFGVLGLAFAGPLVHGVIGAKGEVAAVATRYLRVIVGGSGTIFFLLQLTSMQRALGSAKTPVSLLVGGNVLNVFLAILFIYGPGPAPAHLAWGGPIAAALGVPRMGMIGAAWATIVARGVVLIPTAMILVRRHGIVRPASPGPDWAEIRRILHIAWPSSAQFVIRICAMLLVNAIVARAFTTDQDQTATTAMGLVFRLDTMALFVAMGWGSAAQTFVGQNLGARNEERAMRSGWVTAAYDMITNVGLIALVYLAGERILRIFDDDPAPVSIALLYLQTVAPSYLGLGVGIVLGNAMAGAGATRTTLGIDVAVIVAFQAPLCLLAVFTFGAEIHTLFRCIAATNLASCFAYAFVYARRGWQRAALGATPGE
jgi:putative MATE family efflux protein